MVVITVCGLKDGRVQNRPLRSSVPSSPGKMRRVMSGVHRLLSVFGPELGYTIQQSFLPSWHGRHPSLLGSCPTGKECRMVTCIFIFTSPLELPF